MREVDERLDQKGSCETEKIAKNKAWKKSAFRQSNQSMGTKRL
jgi:hypothetical protein